jgi:ketosteroid isomerase-like protein
MMSQLGLLPKEAGPHRAAMEKGMDGAPVIVIATDDAKEKANLAAVTKSNAAFDAHKLADMSALMSDDAVESDQASEKDTVGKKDIEKGAKMFLESFSDGKLVKPDLWGAGDYVVTLSTFEGTNDHDMGPMKKTGKKVSIPVAEVSLVKDGKISHFWRFYSSFDFAQQLGMMPAPGAAPAGGGSAAGSGSAAAGSGSGK